MRATLKRHTLTLVLAVPFFLLSTEEADAQRRGDKTKAEVKVTAEITSEITAEFTLSIGDRQQIREYYTSNPQPESEVLPPGMRKRLGKGKPLPPGIAKRVAPQELQSKLTVSHEYELVEVGLDVLLVEVATGIIHDILMDVIR